jgi:hypothetical protein
MKSLRVKLGAIAIVLVAAWMATMPAFAWLSGTSGDHRTITDLALTNMTLPSVWDRSTVVNESTTPDYWTPTGTESWPYYGRHCNQWYHGFSALSNQMAYRVEDCAADYAWRSPSSGAGVSAAEFGWALHFVEDAGQPFHGESTYTDNHKAFENYAAKFLAMNCNNIQGVMKTQYPATMPNTHNAHEDIRTYVQGLENQVWNNYYTPLNTVISRPNVKVWSGAVTVCGVRYTPAGYPAVDEAALYSTDVDTLRNNTTYAYLYVSSYVKGMVAFENARNHPGDVNDLPGVDVGDSLFVSQFVNGSRTPTPDQWNLADANCSLAIDIGDVLFINQYINGSRTTLWCP